MARQRKPLADAEILAAFEEFLYHGELLDFVRAQHSFERVSSSLGTTDFDALIPPCLEVLEFSNQFIRNDTLLCLLYISLGCTLCDLPSAELLPLMRNNSAKLMWHGAAPMFVRSLDFLLGCDGERGLSEEGMFEREFRLIANCIFIQVLFNEHDESFVRSLEVGHGRLRASLVSLLFEATKMCADSERIPIKKVILLLLRVLRCVLDVPDYVLYPLPSVGEPSTLETLRPPKLRDFQAFTALHLHERCLRQGYAGSGSPLAIQEGLSIIERYKDEFLMNYDFHPSEVAFMQSTPFLFDAHARYERLLARGLTLRGRERAAHSRGRPPPQLPRTEDAEAWASKGAPTPLGAFIAPENGTSRAEIGSEGEASISESEASEAASSTASSVVTAIECIPSPRDTEELASAAATLPPGEEDAEEDPDAKEPRSDSSSVFKSLYLQIYPRLTETVVLLLRLLLTSCSNIENYPGIVDFARERQATALSHNGSREFAAALEQAIPSESVESQRHCEITAAAVSGVLLVLLRQARHSAAEQFSFLAQLITDSNGALVILKFLNQDLSGALTPYDHPPVLGCLQAAARAGPSWTACATLRLLAILYLLCRDSPDRVRKYLVHYKASLILRRLHRFENQQVQDLVLKLLRKQVRYLPRKWKQANMKAVSAIYGSIPMSPLEDWLLNEPIGDWATEGPTHTDVRSSNAAYNSRLQQDAAHLLAKTTTSRPRTDVRSGTDVARSISSYQASADEAMLAVASLPGLSIARAAALQRGGRAAAEEAIAGEGGARSATETEAEVWCYARLFPEFVPPGCA